MNWSWIIHRYLWTIYGWYIDMFFEIKKSSKTEKWWKRKRRAPENDSYPSNQFFFNVRKQFKYEKNTWLQMRWISVDYQCIFYRYLWIINLKPIDILSSFFFGWWGGWGCDVTSPKPPLPPPQVTHVRSLNKKTFSSLGGAGGTRLRWKSLAGRRIF